MCRDPEMISITSAPEAPPPRIRIVDNARREVETVRIGDRLTFRIEIPDDSEFIKFITLQGDAKICLWFAAPYGIFARSCVAMAKDSKSTFEIIDENGYDFSLKFFLVNYFVQKFLFFLIIILHFFF